MFFTSMISSTPLKDTGRQSYARFFRDTVWNNLHAVWSVASELTITPACVTAAHWYTPSWPARLAAETDEDEDEKRLNAEINSCPSLVSSIPRLRATCDDIVLPFSAHRMLAVCGSTAHVRATELPVRTMLDWGSTVKRGTIVADVITPVSTTKNVIAVLILENTRKHGIMDITIWLTAVLLRLLTITLC